MICIDITMPNINCPDFGLDFVDHAGDMQLEVADNIEKVPLPGKGPYLSIFLRF